MLAAVQETIPGQVPGLSPNDMSELLHLVYRGALDEVPWHDALQRVGQLLTANWVTLMVRPPVVDRAGLILVAKTGRPVRAAVAYSQYGYALDPFVKLPLDQVMSLDELMEEAEYKRGEFYKQFLAPADVEYMLGTDFRTLDGVDCHFRLCRSREAGPFTKTDRAFCEMLLPHLKLAVHMHSLLDVKESERKLYAGAVDRMAVGTVILDETGAIVSTNTVADEIFAERDGIRLTQGTIKIEYAHEEREFQKLLRKTLAVPSEAGPVMAEAISITRPSGKAKLGMVLRTVALSEWSEGKRRPAVVIFLRDPERKTQASQDILQQLFDLTPAEAALSILLANGLNLEEAADELDVRKNTARAHLRSIFSKTGVTRQTTLIRLVLSSVAQLG
ncbi:helix-turn-helix transcriptional regulator [Pandoraea pneumonica]|uniref:Helix-turn-helix transcriptional regulator n=1 Tax=Pandoraea pneumonica TaxID=2508299 RepID=A0A5E4SIK4_9BURK|nr:helix-turn-helix transcriptional regulator [Pandoraea pneumonica]VVD73859.1 helix-turn-helix transcriptional regulator [Pandoraea pneumonica]